MNSAMASLLTGAILYLPILIMFIGSVCIVDINGGGVDIFKGQREFDYFKLSLQWPGNVCRGTRRCCSFNGCCRDYNDGTWPSCCTKSDFDVKEIATLRDALEKYWPSYSCSLTSTCSGKKGLFWAHEMSMAVGLTNKCKPEVLNEAGNVPSNSEKYPLGGIVYAIQNAFHATPELSCSKGAVEELQLCFYKDFKPQDCVIGPSSGQSDMISSKGSCSKYVSLPEHVSLGLKNGETPGSWLMKPFELIVHDQYINCFSGLQEVYDMPNY